MGDRENPQMFSGICNRDAPRSNGVAISNGCFEWRSKLDAHACLIIIVKTQIRMHTRQCFTRRCVVDYRDAIIQEIGIHGWLISQDHLTKSRDSIPSSSTQQSRAICSESNSCLANNTFSSTERKADEEDILVKITGGYLCTIYCICSILSDRKFFGHETTANGICMYNEDQ